MAVALGEALPLSGLWTWVISVNILASHHFREVCPLMSDFKAYCLSFSPGKQGQ